jgi:hypothetical protein
MSLAPTSQQPLRLPESLREQLSGFRRRVWWTKLGEAAALAACGLLVAFLVVFITDRLWETPQPVLWLVFSGVLAGVLCFPWAAHRWIWRHRRPDQLARLLGRRLPTVGDQLLGVIELAEDRSEQSRSRALCAAAMEQVAQSAASRDLTQAAPASRHRQLAWLAAGGLLLVAGLGWWFPMAASNAWRRSLLPWLGTPRYTFTQLDRFPSRLVVPQGERWDWRVQLSGESRWQPPVARVRMVGGQMQQEVLRAGGYAFELPPLLEPNGLDVWVGDFRQRVQVEPKARPELVAVESVVRLPRYLQRNEPQRRPLRGGTLSVVRGGQLTLEATANRPIENAWSNASALAVRGEGFKTSPLGIEQDEQLELMWQDYDGLTARRPMRVQVQMIEDMPPTVTVEGLPRQAVVLDSEQLNFQLLASDDFGVRRVGLQWSPLSDEPSPQPMGSRLLAAGGPEQMELAADATFTATTLGIEPQPIQLQLWAEDYSPDHPPSLSAKYILYVLSPDQHAAWISEQLSRWHRQAIEVRDRELRLYQTNLQLRQLSPGELAEPENRQRLESQAAAERSNARRLGGLTASGRQLLQQAARNPEMAVGHLEDWAEMLKVLEDIAGSRMPSVAELLREAADQAFQAGDGNESGGGPMAGQIQPPVAPPADTGDSDQEPGEAAGDESQTPAVVDQESSQQPMEPGAASPPGDSAAAGAALSLPSTTLTGPPQAESDPPPPPAQSPAQASLDEALAQQAALLAEFQKIADELNELLANLEGSTLVKRLKALSRLEYQFAGRLRETLSGAFGIRALNRIGREYKLLQEMVSEQDQAVTTISYIIDDLQAFYDRRQMAQFGLILQEARQLDPVGGLRGLTDQLLDRQGLSMAEAEFWSDTFDRWAEDLVDPASGGASAEAKTPESLPPAVVLEVLRILQAEVDLREETRVAEQARRAVMADQHRSESQRLAETQGEVRERVTGVIEVIADLPQALENFSFELGLLRQVGSIMSEASDLLGGGETGPVTLAAQTEAIELLLQSRRINPSSGSGGGSSPGGGGGGDTADAALALIGQGVDDKAVINDRPVTQATGATGRQLPEEFRAGLDEYFNQLDAAGQP